LNRKVGCGDPLKKEEESRIREYLLTEKMTRGGKGVSRIIGKMDDLGKSSGEVRRETLCAAHAGTLARGEKSDCPLSWTNYTSKKEDLSKSVHETTE